MESQTQRNKDYCHYNHTDPCNISRWTARECYQFMYSKPWQQVLDFYSNVVNGNLTLAALFGSEFRGLYPQKSLVNDDAHVLEAPHKAEQRNVAVVTGTGRWARVTYKIVVSYHGSSFDGWQKQPGLNTVQGIIEKSLGKFVDEKKVKQLKDKGFAVEGSASVAGRTDKGVTALQQVCSFYTWRTDVKAQDIEDEVNNAAPEKLSVVSVSRESRMFHPNFSAKWRRYFYIFPLNDREDDLQSSNSEEYVGTLTSREDDSENFNNSVLNEIDEVQSGKKPTQFSISRVNLLLRRLEGKLLSYKMFARDTKASRADGPPTECFVYCARAVEARLPCPDHVEGIRVMCVELVANRFLRKMVRVLVATSIREAAAGAEDDALLKLMDATCRRATAPPAPPDGLCLVDVGYTEFDLQNCIIPS